MPDSPDRGAWERMGGTSGLTQPQEWLLLWCSLLGPQKESWLVSHCCDKYLESSSGEGGVVLAKLSWAACGRDVRPFTPLVVEWGGASRRRWMQAPGYWPPLSFYSVWDLQPVRWRLSNSGWVFLPQINLSGNALVGTPRVSSRRF